jgi:hypothetical protein
MSQRYHRSGSPRARPAHPTPYTDFFDGLGPGVKDLNRVSRGLHDVLRRRAESADIDLKVDGQAFDPEFLPALCDEVIAAAQAMKEAAVLYSKRRGAVDQW